jgi:murein DD-endopeptidase MepM/ murein hydrolase activator NlpD
VTKHRAARSRRSQSLPSESAEPATPSASRRSPQHRRARAEAKTTGAAVSALLILGVLAVGIGGGTAPEGGSDVDASTESTPDVATMRDLVEERQLQLSRGSGWRALDAQRRQERAAEREQRQRERARRLAEQARREAARQAQEAREARAWRPPLSGYRITATFGQSSSLWSTVHTGVDLAAPAGIPVTSTAAGTVTFAGYDGAYGYKVVVQHDDGTETWYAHLSSISVSVGQTVSHHTVVGPVGSSGNVTGPHLHLEVRPVGGEPVDPLTALAARNVHL